MTVRLLALLALSLLAPWTARAATQTVAAARLVDAARAALRALPLAPDTRLDLRVVGQPADAVLPAGALAIQALPPPGRWPRARVAVPVRLRLAGRPAKTATVWFAVRAIRPLDVYAEDAGQGTPTAAVRRRRAEVDTARLHGHPLDAAAVVQGRRLRRAMLAGAPVLEEDFEPVPDVDARQQVTVLVRYGAIRMQTRGTALGTGDAGQTVAVLAAGAEAPVQARVTGKGVVEVAR